MGEDQVRVELMGADVKRGFIDFARAGGGQGKLKADYLLSALNDI
jgi:hypothetical protein